MKTATATQTPPAPPPPPPKPTHAAPALPPSADDAPAESLSLKIRHREPFAEARDTIIERYGVTPASDDLMRHWLASATPWQIVRGFEEGVLALTGSDLAGTDDDQYILGL